MSFRITAIGSNVAFIAYGWLDHLTAILILYAVLLPLNLVRVVQLRRRPATPTTALPDAHKTVRLS